MDGRVMAVIRGVVSVEFPALTWQRASYGDPVGPMRYDKLVYARRYHDGPLFDYQPSDPPR